MTRNPRPADSSMVHNSGMLTVRRAVGAVLCAATIVMAGVGSGAQTPAPFQPQPILTGGQIVILFPPDSPYLNKARIAEPEQITMTNGVPGRIQSIINIHNPSIEFHPVDRGSNTGAVVILAAGGAHNTLNVGG